MSVAIADGSIDQPLVWGALAQMTRRPERVVDAMATKGVRAIAVNRRYTLALEAMEHFSRKAGVQVRPVDDIYPFGGGVPLHDLTGELWVSVAGAVRRPVVVRAEPGAPVGDLLRQAEPLDEHAAILLGTGPAKARPATRWEPVGPNAHSILVLPQDHPLVRRHRRTMPEEIRIGMSLCSGCRQCTDGCPQYLAGRPVEPHRLMQALLQGGRSIGHGSEGPPGDDARWEHDLAGLADCHGCNLCSLVLCPVGLSPSRWAAELAESLRAAGAPLPGEGPAPGDEPAADDPRSSEAHPRRDGRRVSVHRLAVRLGLEPYLQQKPTYVEG